jgi:hypothetical protein
LPFSRRVFIISPSLIEGAAKVLPIHVAGGAGTVLVVFRTSEQGGVVDMRSTGGSFEMQRSSEAALSQWKFSPIRIGSGQPSEVFSAVIFDFSGDQPSITLPKPMSAAQISPRLGYPCSNALAHQSSDAVSLCKKQLDTISQDPRSTPMERFTALDEYGLALLSSAHRPDLALQQFTQAIETAPKGLKPSDAESAYVYWHRGVAALQTGSETQAKHDFAMANESMKLAEAAIGITSNAYYRQLEGQLDIILHSQHP